MADHRMIVNTPESLNRPATINSAKIMVDGGKKGQIRLRRVISETDLRTTCFGRFFEEFITLFPWKPKKVLRLTGFNITGTLDDERRALNPNLEPAGEVLVLLSADEGSTFLYYDTGSSSWVAAGSLFNTISEVDEGIPTFPFEDSLTIRVKLIPRESPFPETPLVDDVIIYCEYDYNSEEDIVRSLIQEINEFVGASVRYRADVTSASVITVETDFPTIAEPIRVYNLTVDPNRRIDLFSSVTGKDVTLTSIQTGKIEIQFEGKAQVHVMSDVDVELAQLPAYVIETPSIDADSIYASHVSVQEDVRISEEKTFFRPRPQAYTVSFRIRCLAHLQLHAFAMLTALRRHFEVTGFLRSRALDEDLDVLEAVNITPVDRNDRNLARKDLLLRVYMKDYLTSGSFETAFGTALAKEIELRTSLGNLNPEDFGPTEPETTIVPEE